MSLFHSLINDFENLDSEAPEEEVFHQDCISKIGPWPFIFTRPNITYFEGKKSRRPGF